MHLPGLVEVVDNDPQQVQTLRKIWEGQGTPDMATIWTMLYPIV